MFRVIHPNRYFFWTIALLIIFGIAALGAVERLNIDEEIASYEILASSSPQIQSLSEWKTYRNVEYGFEFKYPAHGKRKGDQNYSSFDFTSDHSEEPGICNFNHDCVYSDTLVIGVWVVHRENDMSLEKYVEKFFNYPFDLPIKFLNKKIINIRGYKGVYAEYEYINQDFMGPIVLIEISPSDIVVFKLDFYNRKEAIEVFQNVLSTLQFLQ